MTREELNAVRGYVSNIQAIKDTHNTDKLPINYGTICDITSNGWKLIEELKALEQQSIEKCKWIKYDYRTICPKNHDINNPYWRIPENTERLKYCPYCGKEIEVDE